LKTQRNGIDAIAFAGCLSRTVIEDMSQVSSTVFTNHLGSSHEERIVLMQFDVFHVELLIELAVQGKKQATAKQVEEIAKGQNLRI
jgi:hypothetical protein